MTKASFKRSMPPEQYFTREAWLTNAMFGLRSIFKEAGYVIPERVRVSCGLPSVKAFGKSKRRIGECWSAKNSKDEHFEIFVSPTIDDTAQVLSTLAHELVHATVGLDCGHRGEFINCARKIGFDKPWTQTPETTHLQTKLKIIADGIGKYPHGSLEGMTNKRKKQTTRLIKVSCLGCCYTIRTTTLWLLTGIPKCPNPDCVNHDEVMEADYPA